MVRGVNGERERARGRGYGKSGWHKKKDRDALGSVEMRGIDLAFSPTRRKRG